MVKICQKPSSSRQVGVVLKKTVGNGPTPKIKERPRSVAEERTKLLSKTGSIDASQLEKFLERSFIGPKKQRFHCSYLNLDVYVLESYNCYGLLAICS